jgi:MFS family permease
MGFNTSLVGLVLVVFLLRFFGQGMMYQLAATAMARWFVGRRGLALSISSMGFMFGQAFYPIIFASLLAFFDWRILWGFAGAMVLVAFPVILRLLSLERMPGALAEAQTRSGMDGRHWTRAEVLRSPFFLMLLPMLLGPPAWGTSLFFQQVHIATVKEWPLVDYLALVPLMTAVSVFVTLTSGSLIDRFGSGRAMQFFMLPWVAVFAILAQTNSLPVAALAFVIFGLATGLQATLITAFWAEFFGTKHIGAIKAASTSIMVFGSAVGPGISGLLIDLGYSFPDQMYAIAGYFLIALVLVCLAVEMAMPRLAEPAEIDVKSA